MVMLTDLPVELLSYVAASVGRFVENEEMVRAVQHNKHAFVTPIADLKSLPALRGVCRLFSQICTPHLFRTVKVLPTRESAARYRQILGSDTLNPHVNKVIFQTRMNSEFEYQEDDYTEPHDFFLEAMENLGLFSKLTSVELVFAKRCAGGDSQWWNDHLPEQIEFREPILEKFFAGLNHRDHPAVGVRSISIKNLQDKTPAALTSTNESTFKTNYRQALSRINHLSLEIATEQYEASPENTLEIPEAHEFFGNELNRYWLEPVRDQLTYLKLYAAEMYWGYFPRCNLPRFPNLITMVLGNMSFTHDAQLDWLLSHGDKLEKLIMDDCPIAVGARIIEHGFGADRHIIRGQSADMIDTTWSYETRWHDHFEKIRTGLPNLKDFVYGSGPWLEGTAFDEADVLTTSLPENRYMYFDEGTGPSNWLDPGVDGVFNEGDDEEDLVYKPTCDDEDQRALDELLHEVRKRR